MHCEGKVKSRSHNTSYCLIEVVTKAGLTVAVNKIHRGKALRKTAEKKLWSVVIT